MSDNQHFQPAFGYEPTEPAIYEQFASISVAETDGAAAYPPKVDLKGKMTPVKDQGPYASCVGFALCSMLEIVPYSLSLTQDESERFIWYNSKHADGPPNPNGNRGTFIATAVGTVQNQGSCWEIRAPYTAPLDGPSVAAYKQALKMKVTRAYRLKDMKLDSLKAMLSIGWPVIVGFDIFGDAAYQARYLTGAYTTRTGIMLMPPAPRPGRTDGHAVVFVGYDDATRLFKFKNSWGQNRGDGGYYYMPYDYLQWTHDAWVLWAQGIDLPVGVNGVKVQALASVAEAGEEKFVFGEGVQPGEVLGLDG